MEPADYQCDDKQCLWEGKGGIYVVKKIWRMN